MTTAWGDPEAYAASFGPLCAGTVEALLDACGPAGSGRSSVDVGTGTGTVAAAAAARGWQVLGVDADPAMVEAARARHPAVVFEVGTLPALPLATGAYDAVSANFVVNHTADPRAAVAELVRVCAPGGRVALTIWPERLIAVNQLWNDVMRAAGVEPPPRKALPDELDFERSVAGLRALVVLAGLSDVEVVEVEVVLRVSPADLWRAADGGIATIGAVYRAQSEAGRAEMRRAYDAATAPLAVDEMMTLPGVALLASGTKPLVSELAPG